MEMQTVSTHLQQPQPHSPGALELRTLSRDTQSKWIERIFQKLLSIYGDRFSANWAHADIADVKETWADALGGFDAETIGRAIKACYDEQHPPKLPDFVALCRKYAKRSYVHDDSQSVSNEQAKAILSEANKRSGYQKGAYDYRGWAKKLRERYLKGERLLPIQISMASEALNETWADGQCKAGR